MKAKTKAPHVWAIEICCGVTKTWEMCMFYRTRREAIARVKYAQQPLPRRLYRIRKYVRQP